MKKLVVIAMAIIYCSCNNNSQDTFDYWEKIYTSRENDLYRYQYNIVANYSNDTEYNRWLDSCNYTLGETRGYLNVLISMGGK